MKQKMMCVLLFFLFLGIYIWTNTKLSFLMVVGMPVLVILALFSNFVAKKMLVVSCTMKSSKGETNGVLQLQLHNRSIFPVFRVNVDISLLNMLTESQVDIKKTYILLPFEKKEERIAFSSLFCGKIEMNRLEARVVDCFGLSSFSCRTDRRGHYYCYPMSKELAAEIDKHVVIRNNTLETYLNRKGNDPTEILDIREYQRGDNVKMIHWKLSHKLGMKVVKELDMPSNQDILLVFALQEETTEESVCRLVEYSLSFSKNLFMMDMHHDVILLDKGGNLIRMYTVESEDTYAWLEKRVLDGQLSLAKADMDAYLTRKDYPNRYATVFYIVDEKPGEDLFGETVEYIVAN